jgi:hypothetical protein
MMSVLDELFSAAAELDATYGVTANMSITISPASPFPSPDLPGNISFGWGQLAYQPSKLVEFGHFAYWTLPIFSGEISISINELPGLGPGPWSSTETIGLAIFGPSVFHIGPATYSVSITLPTAQPVSFTPQVDPTTNVVYGPESANFIAISLGGPMQGQAPPQ